ncbi:pentapeptide repeat-containing protein [Sphaerisporangium sp. NPDC004334]
MGEVDKSGSGGPAEPDKSRPRAKAPGLRLMRIGPALAVTGAAAVALLAGVITGGLVLLGVEGLRPEARVSAATLFELLKIAFAVVAGVGGLVALVVAYRRQKVVEAAQILAEQAEQRAHRGEQREATKLHNDRFATAAGQLGHDSPAVRLAGAHALAGLADDAPTRELRQTCIDVLCAYLRMPYSPEPLDDVPEAERLAFAGLREVRQTIIRLITAHLREGAVVSWQGHDLDFTGVVFDGGDFKGAVFSGGTVHFTGAKFSDGAVQFISAKFSDGMVSFIGAEFSGRTVDFIHTEFSGSSVSFFGAKFSGGLVSFQGAKFSGGTVSFGAEFSGSVVSFIYANFSGGVVDFIGAKFSSGMVDLSEPKQWDTPPIGLPDPVPTELRLPAGGAGGGGASEGGAGEPVIREE